MKLTQFTLKLGEIDIKGEYEGNLSSGKAVIFSHGFGVKRDSRGKFIALGNRLKNDFLVVRFDYNRSIPKNNATYVYPYNVQAKMLGGVINYVREILENAEINIVSHSAGCLVTASLSPNNVKTVVMSSAPTSFPYKEMVEYFSKRPETKFNESGLSKMKRSDGSWTYVDVDFWKDVKEVNPLALYNGLANKTKLCFIFATNDEILKGGLEGLKKIGNIKYYEINADHSFSGQARKKWLELSESLLK